MGKYHYGKIKYRYTCIRKTGPPVGKLSVDLFAKVVRRKSPAPGETGRVLETGRLDPTQVNGTNGSVPLPAAVPIANLDEQSGDVENKEGWDII